jgi:signal peptidase I
VQAFLALAAWAVVAALSVWLFLEPFGSAVAIWLAALLLVSAILGVPIHAATVARAGRPLSVNRWLRLAIYLAFLVAFSEGATRSARWIRSDVAEPFRAPAAGMVPTLYPGDHFFVDKRAYLRALPQRGDIVVFWIARDGTQVVPADSRLELPREQFVKRVVGVPGDRILVTGDAVHLNGAPLSVSRSGSTTEAGHQLELWSESINGTSYTIARDPSRTSPDSPEVVVPPGRYFVLGDNRDHSNDSRYWGTILGAEIIGEVSHLYFSRNPSTGDFAWERIGMRVE